MGERTDRDEDIVVSSPADASSPYYASREREALLDQLVHLVQFGDGLPIVVGPEASGKTTLIQELGRQFDSVDECILVTLSSQTQLVDLLAKILRGLGVLAKSTAGELLAQVRVWSQQLAAEQMKAVVLVDNADFVDDAALGALLSLQQGGENAGFGLRLVFSAERDLLERVDALQLVDVPVFDFECPPLEYDDWVAGFLRAGGEDYGAALFGQAWAQALGNPGKAEVLIAIAAEARESQPTSQVDFDLPPVDESDPVPAQPLSRKILPVGHIVALALLITVLVWALLLRDESEPSVNTTPLPAPISDNQSPGHTDNADATGTIQPSVVPDNEVVRVEGGIDEGAREVVQGQPEAEKLLAQTVATPTPAPTAVPSVAPVSRAQKSAAKPDDLTADEAFLISRRDTEFTLQVLSATKKGALEAYLARQSNRRDLHLYRVSRAGRPVYVVLAGVYESKEAALLALKSLPKEQKNAGPWPRSIGDVKREIKENR
ncbi:SPOR domain-containing protein [Teredinibacter turnerae]|uniref:SPOR domain-containing protein n=1 Tax=Teredinibacter turnerae TaxID=2426 RepID=UPI0005F79886|nr:AAA family ATPase [Teredinibacter turnerae]